MLPFLDSNRNLVKKFLQFCSLAVALLWNPALPDFGYAQVPTSGEAGQGVDEYFEKQVRPLLIDKCYECHSQSTEQNGGLALDSLQAMIQGGDSGPALRIDSLDESLIIRAIRYRDPKLQMPPDTRMTAGEVKILEDWVVGGSKVSADFKKPDLELAAKSTALTVERAREHWAYRPIARPTLPHSDQTNPIDVWVDRRATEMGLPIGPLIDDPTWIRRLVIDLHGINPTIDIVEMGSKSLSKADPTAVESVRLNLVDHLLESPRYGERFARHWMDVVRYAESLTLRGFILTDVWRYRNYLIDAYNLDKPFDQMIVEQIAGDLVDATDADQASIEKRQARWVATTFWALGDHNYEEQDKKQLEMDAVDEQLDVLGRAFLAQTLGCARCHDHKFDPIPTADYYALAGILKSSISMEHENVSKWIRMPLPLPQEQQAEFERISKKIAELKQEVSRLKQQLKKGNASSSIVKSSEAAGVVVDDRSAKKIGSWKDSNSVKHYVDEGYLHDENKDRGKKSVTFEPQTLATGTYTVRMSYAYGDNRSTKTQVRVSSADGDSTVTVNQKKPPSDDGLWHTLGKFRFEKDGAAFVIVSNEDADGHVVADSVQFLPDSNSKPEITAAESSDDDKEEGLKKAIADTEKQQADLQKLLDLRPMVETIRPDEKPMDLGIHVRGSVHRIGESVPRGFLRCINSHEPQLDQRIRIEPSANGRLELAQWLIAPENPLTARVYVNRIWYQLMGQGIVPTIDNFGTTGQNPSNPELLDWLASEFVAQGWSTKWLVRTIVTSKAYRRSLATSPEVLEKDPENLSFTRGNLRRLDSEALRDSMLLASGELQLGGSVESTIRKGTNSDYRYQHDVGLRSVYLPWFRNSLPPLVREFDGANPSFSISQRNRSTVATQALAIMNNPWVRDRAAAVVHSLYAGSGEQQDPEDRIEKIDDIFRRILGRDPDESELLWAKELLKTDDLIELAHQLFCSIDFRYAP